MTVCLSAPLRTVANRRDIRANGHFQTFTLRSFAQQVEAQFPAAAEWWNGERTFPLYTESFLDCVAGAGKLEVSEISVIGINFDATNK